MKRIVSLILTFLMITAVFAASVSFNAGLAGDCNDDGYVDNKDVVVLFRFVSGNKDGAIEDNCDYNGDGAIDNKDVVALFRAVSGTGQQTGFEEFVVTPDQSATLSASRVFGRYMVLQRNKPIKVWGFSNKDGAKIRGTFMGEETRGEVKDGKWEITFSAKEATAEAQTLTVEDSCGNKIEFTDVLVGDVWLVGGQSNAEAIAGQLPKAGADISADGTKPLRLFHQSADDVINNRSIAKDPCEDVIVAKRKWMKSNRQGATAFSLLGWFVGEKLIDECGVPIGFISVAASGANMKELMPKEVASSFGYTTGGTVGLSEYYNGLTHPFLKLQFTGMVFFQGESDSSAGADSYANNYARNFEALMNELRSRWGFDFPIYNVQLSDYTSQSVSGFPLVGVVRAQQYKAYKNMTGVRLIPSYDLGADESDANYLHSPYKKALGYRIADLILADVYGVGSADAALAPEPVSVKVVSRNNDMKTVEIKFANVGDGLVSQAGGNTFNGCVYGSNSSPKSVTKVSGKITAKDTVQITVSGKATYAGYACAAHVADSDVQLLNSYGLPVLAFYLPIQ